jgi:hypothetical protein
MMPLRHNVPADYRARAKAARENDGAFTDEPETALLNDAALWERMAAHEEKNPQLARPNDPEKDNC